MNDTCTNVTFVGNTGKDNKTPWSFHCIASSTVSGNLPGGAVQCMQGAMKATNNCKL